MKPARAWQLALGATGLALVFAAALALKDSGAKTAEARADSGYASSDPALLSATGRPQLVEFFSHA